ncbi:MAG: leucyl aminopeptidase [Microgenomates group bacterium]|nr:leucyl aminopeptidase [Microgenomates group bacterium]
MDLKIRVVTGTLPIQPETAIFFSFEEKLEKNQSLNFFDKLQLERIKQITQKKDFQGKEKQILMIENIAPYQSIVLVGAGKRSDFNLVKFKKFLALAIKKIIGEKYNSAILRYFEQLGKNWVQLGKTIAEAFYLSNYYFDFYKSSEEKKKLHHLREFIFSVPNGNQIKKIEEGINLGQIISQGVYLTRDLVNFPASQVHPETLVEEAFKIEKASRGKIQVEILDEDECQRLGMGAFLGVSQGSERKPKFIILHYPNRSLNSDSLTPRAGKIRSVGISSSRIPRICLIGKSITFDSGGLSLKPSEAMEAMKIDMAGGAAVLGVFQILTQLDEKIYPVNYEIYGILPACENMPSGKALKPGDVLQALNGKTIEVLNTDAEGRLTLADALCFAEKHLKPDLIIDLATLTGACMVALGREITGLFGNNKKWLEKFKKSVKEEGEELWELPLYQDYKRMLESDIADYKNVGGRYGGAITAALFLENFVSKTAWLHLDIAGSAYNWDKIEDIRSKGATGWGVTSIINFLLKK